MMHRSLFPCVLLPVLWVFSGCKDTTVHNADSSGSDSASASERDDDTTTQKSNDTASASEDSASSSETDTATSMASTESESVTDSATSTEVQSDDDSSDNETDTQESTDSSTVGVGSDEDSADSSTVDTDGHGDTSTTTSRDSDSDNGTDVSTDSAEDAGGPIDTGDDTSSEDNGGPDSGPEKDSETEPPADCSIVGVNDFGDCEMSLGWARAGNHCAPISGCSCEPYCDRFFETEDACVVTCFGLIACGGPLGNTCADDQYCDFKTGENCGDEGATAICRIRQQGCEAIYWPVCGCDGNTYANDCEAGAVGWGYRYDGICN